MNKGISSKILLLMSMILTASGCNNSNQLGQNLLNASEMPPNPNGTPIPTPTPLPAANCNHYTAPTGQSSGDGSVSNPWDLQTALNQPTSLHPGDTLCLIGGTYAGKFTSKLTGTQSQPIIVRPYPGDHVTIDGYSPTSTADVLDINGSWAEYIELEVVDSNPVRSTTITGSGGPPGISGEALTLLGTHLKLINSVLHDTGEGVGSWTSSPANEIYGNIIYYNGWSAPDRGHGHSIYVANPLGQGEKIISDNISFDQFDINVHAYTEGGNLDDLSFTGNISFQASSMVGSSGYNILVGGLQVAHNPVIDSNFTYNVSRSGTANDLGYSAGCANATITNNYFMDGALKLVNCAVATMTGNSFFGAMSGFSQSQFPNNTYYSAKPTGVKVFVRPNQYETGRAHIVVYNWDGVSSTDVDLSGVLTVGTSFKVLNAQNYFGTPVLSGTYAGGTITLPLTGLTKASPINWPTPPNTGSEFNVFVVVPTN